MKILDPSDDAITQACAILRGGGLVAFPTETVYGLGADATNQSALERLYQAKGRPADHPVIVHLACVEQISEWASVFSPSARLLAQRFCPGPLTLILPKGKHVLPQITGGQDKVGLRIPSHPVAHRLLAAFGGGLAAPSANKFGRLSPTAAFDVAREFAQEVALVLEGGAPQVGIESTIVDFTCTPPAILRPGMIAAGQIRQVIGALQAPEQLTLADATRAPGTLASHYAPSTKLELISAAHLQERLRFHCDSGASAAVLAFQEDMALASCWIVASSDPARYAHDLYRNLRQLDGVQADVILVEAVPDQESWAGVADRLRRAATKP